MKRLNLWFIIFLFLIVNSNYGLKVGLDSGHSIKELYKSGGSFKVQIKEPNQPIETKSYYSVAWPAGGGKIEGMRVPGGVPSRKSYFLLRNSLEIEKWDDYNDSTHSISFSNVIALAEGKGVSQAMKLEKDYYAAPFEDVRQIAVKWNDKSTSMTKNLSLNKFVVNLDFNDNDISFLNSLIKTRLKSLTGKTIWDTISLSVTKKSPMHGDRYRPQKPRKFC